MKDALIILNLIRLTGCEAYIVGGTVRDSILNRKSNDIDIATNAPIETIENIFKTHDIGKNKEFGVCVVEHGGKNYEVAHFRTDGEYSNGRHPDSVTLTSSLKEDTLRRDFTINGMAIDVNGGIVDHVGGQQDLALGVIRTIGDPNKRFQEDYLRMLRAVRFAATFLFDIEEETFNAIKENAHKIKLISSERIYKELYKMASCTGSLFADAISLLKRTNLLKEILPEIDQMDQFEHTEETHPEGNVYEHTLTALEYSVSTEPEYNLSILFHDVGKIVTRTYNENGTVCYYGHAVKGLPIIEDICKRLHIPNDTKECILFTAENHMIVPLFKELKDHKMLRLINNKNWDVLYNTCHVDDIARGDTLANSNIWSELNTITKDLKKRYLDNQKLTKIKSIVNGNLIMDLRKISPSQEVGRVQKETVEWIIDNNISTEDITAITDHIIAVT